MTPRLALAAITDEFSPDLDVALDAMQEIGMTAAELRVVWGRNVIDLSDAEVDRARQHVEARGMTVLSIASPVLKCVLPDAPAVDPRIQQDVFGARHTFEDQRRLAERAFQIALRTGAPIVRVFSYWRTVDPPACVDRVASALHALADGAARVGLTVGLENEHACNVATGAETAELMARVVHPALEIIWDPANALVAGEIGYPDGYRRLPVDRIVHVHAKDCRVVDHAPIWGVPGEMDVNWPGQLSALVRDGYRGAVSLETHWAGPNGNKLEGSRIAGRRLRSLLEQAQ
jgi:sugar phosphate isomerase/epimerase